MADLTPPAARMMVPYTLSVTVVDRGNSLQSASLEVTVDSTVMATVIASMTMRAMTPRQQRYPPEFETVNLKALRIRTVPSAAEESVVKETAYSITLLNADRDEIDRSISRDTFFEISVPENIVNVSVMFEGEEFTLPR